MFSPSVRLYTTENAESMVQRKPGSVVKRKPFVDRSVNSKTPETNRLQKPKPNLLKPDVAVIEKPKVSPDSKISLDAEEFTFSFKDVEDSYEDMWSKSQLSTDKLVKILRNYCDDETVPSTPEPAPVDIHPMFLDLPSFSSQVFQLDEEFLDNSLDVDVPYFDENELDMSF